jgi:serine/threonine protein kinase
MLSGSQNRYTLCGTIEYVAPEMLRNEPYGSSVDLWTVGVLAYEALVGRTPFAVPQGVSEVDMDCGHLDPAHLHFPDYVSPLAQNFIAKVRTRAY